MIPDSFFKNFLEKISRYYRKGFDAVMVNSKVYNSNNIYANFIYCSHKKN